MEHDFGGYATKAGLKCSDGRTIMPGAFEDMDGKRVPLVWHHGHDSPENVLGHAILEARDDGVYAKGYFNKTKMADHARELVHHKDIDTLSIFANKLVQKSKQVFHGIIHEVSLVMAGANPGAKIDYVAIQHSDGTEELIDDEAVIYTGLNLQFEDPVEHAEGSESSSDNKSEENSNEDDDGTNVKEIYDAFSDKQKSVVHYMIGAAIEDATEGKTAKHSDNDNAGESLGNEEGNETMNVFENNNGSGSSGGASDDDHVLSHDAMRGIVEEAQKIGSMKEAVEEYAIEHGITNIEVLFPEAKMIGNTPEWEKRRTEWVSKVYGGVRKTPFSRIKTRSADITHDEARAKGYVKGTLKKEEFFGIKQRVTTPTTVYKKQALDRDDMIDITDFNVVTWLKAEMRMMLEEEMARAILIGDGRDVAHEDKIKDPMSASEGAGIRSILHDHELYVTTVNVNLDDADSDYNEVLDSVLRARRFYKGSGNATFFTTAEHLSEMLLLKDGFKRRLYNSKAELATALMAKEVVEVEVMEDEPDVVGIYVNLSDYAMGADKGGEVTMFDDFDIDYNKYKYLIETRVSGALTKIKSALLIKKVEGTDVLVDPADPAFDGTDVTITNQTGVEYYDASNDSVMNAAGSPYAVASGETLSVYATPASGYYFATTAEDQWSFTNPA